MASTPHNGENQPAPAQVKPVSVPSGARGPTEGQDEQNSRSLAGDVMTAQIAEITKMRKMLKERR